MPSSSDPVLSRTVHICSAFIEWLLNLPAIWATGDTTTWHPPGTPAWAHMFLNLSCNRWWPTTCLEKCCLPVCARVSTRRHNDSSPLQSGAKWNLPVLSLKPNVHYSTTFMTCMVPHIINSNLFWLPSALSLLENCIVPKHLCWYSRNAWILWGNNCGGQVDQINLEAVSFDCGTNYSWTHLACRSAFAKHQVSYSLSICNTMHEDLFALDHHGWLWLLHWHKMHDPDLLHLTK